MGYDIVKFTITGRVSRHNSEQDYIDDHEWENLVLSIQEIIDNDPEYSRIVIDYG